jgi:hypothetical protein
MVKGKRQASVNSGGVYSPLAFRFASPGLATQASFGLAKRRQQPERYAPFGLKIVEEYNENTVYII